METIVLAAIPGADRILNIATVAIGLGLVIFFHELGHFAVAKWCGVMVERFSIGFGPILWKRKWGETEYALSAIPFGGYVKMLGQDDIDPGQMTDEQVAGDPRSYTSKSVLQRMAIISAGVTMNIITGFLFFMLAFRSGVETIQPEVGSVRVGMPAWEHGLRRGDIITAMNGKDVHEFGDVLRQTALSRGMIQVVGKHADGTTFDETFEPLAPDSDRNRVHRMIGVGFQQDLQVRDVKDNKEIPISMPGSTAASAGFEAGDRIVEADGQPLSSFLAFEKLLNEKRNEALTLIIERKAAGEKPASQDTITVQPQPFRTVGLRMSIGKVSAVRENSPAALAGIKKGDLITHVDGKDVGKDLDPMRLPDYFSERKGQSVLLAIKPEVKSGEPQIKEVTVTPDDRLPWSEPPEEERTPLSIPSLGVAIELLSNVLHVDPGGPADGKEIEPGDSIVSMTLPADKSLNPNAKDVTLGIDDAGWPYAFWRLQQSPSVSQVTLKVRKPASKDAREIVVKVQNEADWFQPGTRGLFFMPLAAERKADSAGEALAMSWDHTRNSIIDIYLTLRNLIFADLSIKSLHGPIGIAKAASMFAEEGLADFLLFLGLISINLAVINFLPIPVLDGGHMVFLLWEAIARRKPSEKVVVAATYMGFAFVLGLMVTVICIDLFVARR